MKQTTRICYGLSRNAQKEIIPSPSAVHVQRIFALYLSGMSLRSIGKQLEADHIPSPSGKPAWTPRTIEMILKNTCYRNLVVSDTVFEQAGTALMRRSNIVETETGTTRKCSRYHSQNSLSGLLICQECGKPYRRITKHDGSVIWRCANRVEHGSRFCKFSPSIPDAHIKMVLEEHFGKTYQETNIHGLVKEISVHYNGTLVIKTNDTPFIS